MPLQGGLRNAEKSRIIEREIMVRPTKNCNLEQVVKTPKTADWQSALQERAVRKYRPAQDQGAMIDRQLLRMLVCPADGTPLAPASDQLVARVNRAIVAGRAANRAGRMLDQPIDGGLLRADKTVLYPIFDSIPLLLVDEAIPMNQFD
jgi:uncharacterized protein YbaR (Trm112 family)